MEEKKTRSAADWELIERHYRAGLLSLREIAKEGGVTEGAIRKRAKKDQWTRNLAAKIQQKADELVRNEVVRTASTQLTPADERQVVEINAQAVANVVISHKKDIARTRNLFSALMDELELETSNKELFESLGEMLDKSYTDENGKEHVDKLNQIYQKVISMSGRVDNAKKLTEILEKVVKLEREAFGIKDVQESSNPIDELLKKINQEVA